MRLLRSRLRCPGLHFFGVFALEPVLGRKRAKESARYFKTYNSQIYTNMSFNFRSFVHFQHLRNSEHAQKEIRELAEAMLQCVKEIPNNPFEYSLKAFNL